MCKKVIFLVDEKMNDFIALWPIVYIQIYGVKCILWAEVKPNFIFSVCVCMCAKMCVNYVCVCVCVCKGLHC